MLAPIANAFRWWFSNQTAPSTTPGTSVTPGASNAEGSATVIATSSDIAEDVYGVLLLIHGGATANNIKNHLLDLGFDPAGGTAYEWIVEDLGVGSSGSVQGAQSRVVWLPIFIPSGSQVAVRIQGNNATAGTVLVWAMFFGKPTRPEMCWAGRYSENLGTISASCGPAVTPGVSAAEGSWTNIGTTVRRIQYIIPCLQMNDSSTTAQVIFMDVAINFAGTRQIIAEHIPVALPGSSEFILNPWDTGWPMFVDIPPNSAVDVRLSTSIATADGAYNVNIVGIG